MYFSLLQLFETSKTNDSVSFFKYIYFTLHLSISSTVPFVCPFNSLRSCFSYHSLASGFWVFWSINSCQFTFFSVLSSCHDNSLFTLQCVVRELFRCQNGIKFSSLLFCLSTTNSCLGLYVESLNFKLGLYKSVHLQFRKSENFCSNSDNENHEKYSCILHESWLSF